MHEAQMPVNAPTKNLTFAAILYHINEGRMVRRAGWNGKGQFVYKTIGNTVSKDFIQKFASLPLSVKVFLQTKGEDIVFNSSLTLYNAQGEMQPGWLASQGDLMAEDWELAA